jgi:hypothetical protein
MQFILDFLTSTSLPQIPAKSFPSSQISLSNDQNCFQYARCSKHAQRSIHRPRTRPHRHPGGYQKSTSPSLIPSPPRQDPSDAAYERLKHVVRKGPVLSYWDYEWQCSDKDEEEERIPWCVRGEEGEVRFIFVERSCGGR